MSSTARGGFTVAVWTQKPFTQLLMRPQGSQGCQNCFLQIKLLSFCAKIDPKLQKLQKTFKIDKKNCQKTMFSYTFLNIPQFRLNISAPNHQNIVKEVLPDILTPLGPMGARQ